MKTSPLNISFEFKQNKDKYINVQVTNVSASKINFHFQNDNEHKCSVLEISDTHQSMETPASVY